MTAVWYDPDCDQIWISDRPEPFAPRTLALREAEGLLHIHRRGQAVSIAAGPFDAFMDGAWQPFGSYDEAVTYLRDVFDRRPQAGLGPLTFTAGEPLSGQRAVRLAGPSTVRVASCDDASQAGLAIGVTQHAADEGAPVVVTVVGQMEEPSWSFAPGPVFLGLNGALVQAPPASGFVLQLGTATAPTRLVLERGAPLILAQ